MHFEDEESLERWQELRRLAAAERGPYPWQREYWWFEMWGMWDYIVHGVILGGIAAFVWWL